MYLLKKAGLNSYILSLKERVWIQAILGPKSTEEYL